jgi:hypothetical protein
LADVPSTPQLHFRTASFRRISSRAQRIAG